MKRPLTLLEVVIGIALGAILITHLFSTFQRMFGTHIKIERAAADNHWRQLTRSRLSNMFATLEHPPALHTDPFTLEFTYDNGPDIEPPFCSKLFASLTLKNNQLLLTTQPNQADVLPRQEVLAPQLSKLNIDLFDPTSKKWVTHWTDEELPPVIRLTLDDEPFLFSIPQSNLVALYK